MRAARFFATCEFGCLSEDSQPDYCKSPLPVEAPQRAGIRLGGSLLKTENRSAPSWMVDTQRVMRVCFQKGPISSEIHTVSGRISRRAQPVHTGRFFAALRARARMTVCRG